MSWAVQKQATVLYQKQNIREWQQQLERTTRVESTPKPLPPASHTQDEKAHRDKNSIHSGEDERLHYFNSLRSQ